MGVRSIFISPVKRWGKRILNNNAFVRKLFRRVLTSDYATRTLLNDDVAMIDLMSHPALRKTDSFAIIEQFLFEKALPNPALHPRIVEWMNTKPSLLKELLSQSQLKSISNREPDYLAQLVVHHKLYEDLIDRDLLEEIFKYEETLDCILENYVLRERLLFDERVIDRIIADPRYHEELLAQKEDLQRFLEDDRLLERILDSRESLDRLFTHSAAHEAILDNASLLETLLPNVGSSQLLKHLSAEDLLGHLTPEQLLNHLTQEQLLGHLNSEAMLDHLGPEEMFNRLTQEQLLNHLNPDVMLDHLGSEEMLNRLTPKQMLDRLDPEAMLSHLDNERLTSHLGPDLMFAALDMPDIVSRMNLNDLINQIDPNGGKMAAYLADHPKTLLAISRDEEALMHLLKSAEIRSRLRLLDGIERSNALPYTLPAAVVCYPRSGSNFAQSILTHSSGMRNISIYTENPSSFIPLLTVKSHALSPQYLEDEFRRLMDTDQLPGKIILVKRDPRDVMISFYEYTKAQRKTEISQDEFLEEIDFFYASTIDKSYSRHLEKAPKSVAAAYKKHVQEWFTDRPKSLPVLEMSYEDMVLEPLKTFRTALDFLELDVSVAEPYLEVKVSLYSDEKRARGIAHSWTSSQEKYSILLKGVERLFSKEIKALGYDNVLQQEKLPSPEPHAPKTLSTKPNSSKKKKPTSTPKKKYKKANRKNVNKGS